MLPPDCATLAIPKRSSKISMPGKEPADREDGPTTTRLVRACGSEVHGELGGRLQTGERESATGEQRDSAKAAK